MNQPTSSAGEKIAERVDKLQLNIGHECKALEDV